MTADPAKMNSKALAKRAGILKGHEESAKIVGKYWEDLYNEAKREGKAEGEKEGLAQGRKLGLEQGIQQGRDDLAEKMRALGVPGELIEKALEE